MSDLDSSLSAVAASLLGLAGNAITYREGATGAPINTVAYRTGDALVTVGTGGATRVGVYECEYTLAFDDLTREPRRGDRVTEEINGVEHVFEVIETASEMPFAWVDPGHTYVVVRCKRVA